MIYTDDIHQDRDNIIMHIDAFFLAQGVSGMHLNSSEVLSVCIRMRSEFPYKAGIDKASVFKKAANFMAHFLELRPIKSQLPNGYKIGDMVDFDINAVIALDIAIICLTDSIIRQKNGNTVKVCNPIYISDHSYADIIEALSNPNMTQKQHYDLLRVLLEQITYKTNRHCEYRPSEDDNDTDNVVGFYIEPFTDLEDDSGE